MANLDFVAVGDITIDAFIRLKDAHVNCDIDKKSCKLCVDFGAKIPYEFVKVVPSVGNSPNAAVAASRLGLKSGLVANLGDDENGKLCLETLREEGVSIDFISSQKEKATNYHYVLWYQDERTILIKHESFTYNLPDIGTPKWLYLSSLGEAGLSLHEKIIEYLDKHPKTNLAFQPGTFQIALGYEKLKKIYKRTNVFFCNVEEAKKILGAKEINILALLKKIKGLGPDIVVITDGRKGAYLLYENEAFFMPSYPDKSEPYERTGAGDAFASTFISALALGKNPLEAIKWAPINSMSVVQFVGAQEGLLSRKKIEEYVKNAPSEYKPEIII